MFWNVVCLSADTNIGSCVEKNELVRAPGIVAAARSIASAIARLFVASPSVWKTTTFGGRTPVPKAFSVRWFASYADLPGIEKLWYQRFETSPAAYAPNTVRTIHVPMTSQRCRTIQCVRRASIGGEHTG